MLVFSGVNPLAVLVGAVIFMVLGALWYSPMLFANRWMAALGRDPAEMMAQGGMVQAYGLTFVGALISVLALAQVVMWSGASSITDGVVMGLVVAIGFVATASLGGVIFERRPKDVYLINLGYNLVAMMIVGALLAVWR